MWLTAPPVATAPRQAEGYEMVGDLAAAADDELTELGLKVCTALFSMIKRGLVTFHSRERFNKKAAACANRTLASTARQ